MVTCGGQATVPIVAAVAQSAPVSYAEIVSSIASKSAGPGTRANIDEFTETTATAHREVGGAAPRQSGHHPQPGRSAASHAQHRYCLTSGATATTGRPSTASIDRHGERSAALRARIPLKQPVQFETSDADNPLHIPETGKFIGTRVTAMLR